MRLATSASRALSPAPARGLAVVRSAPVTMARIICSITAVTAASGRVTHYVGTLTDITLRKAAEDELRRRAAETIRFIATR